MGFLVSIFCSWVLLSEFNGFGCCFNSIIAINFNGSWLFPLVEPQNSYKKKQIGICSPIVFR
ncbi:hypothetical protein CIPAW_03G224900 [Carya illinoinensis]|uniref:Uncharacterized protein n=1 Tax=Carya illinoinensis TaxID=32201 RepID=A0A8T1R6M4_CARIL|nr:hypothetical protein CIPAW_03G224900 [Carya illinoinensis]